MPAPEPNLTALAIRPLVSGLRALGHDPAPILRGFGISEAMLGDPDARVPARAVHGFLSQAAATTGDPDLGLHLAEHAALDSVDVHFYAMLSSPTLGDAYRRMCRYQRLIHEATRIELEIEDARGELRHRTPGGAAEPRHAAEFLLAAWVRMGRHVTGVDWEPGEVRFAHPAPADVSEHRRIFRAPLHFSTAPNALVLPAALLDLPCVRADATLAALLDRHAAERLERAPRTDSLADRVRSVLAEALDGGEAGASHVASRLHTSVRTLHRTLAGEGTSFGEVLAELRKELAGRYLADPRVSIAEVAFLLGFSELSSFHRAFRRWTGRTPAEFRSQRLAPPA